jgi:hypothetical protein
VSAPQVTLDSHLGQTVNLIDGVEELTVDLRDVPELIARLRAICPRPVPEPTDSEQMAWAVAARQTDRVVRLRHLLARYALHVADAEGTAFLEGLVLGDRDVAPLSPEDEAEVVEIVNAPDPG